MTRLVTPSVLGVTLFLAMAAAEASAAPCGAPPLPPPTGTIVTVSTERELQAAVSELTSGTTILLQPGTYNLTSTLWLDRNVQDVAIRGVTDSCDHVILVGRGMSNPSYGAVPHGIWIGNAQRVLVANLTIRDVYLHAIHLDPGAGAQSPHIYNVRLVDAGEQFIQSSSSSGGLNDGIVEHSVMEYTTTARTAHTSGVDVHSGANWIIRRNLFRNIRAPEGSLAGPAILAWNRSRDTIVEGNLFLNCQYGIALGIDPGRADDHVGGVVRNNFFHRSGAQSGGAGITINNSAGTKVLHNTVVLSGTYPNAVEYRFPATTGVEIRFNLADAAVRAGDGAAGQVSGNVTGAEPGWFVNAGTGDLHLTAAALGAIDRAVLHPDVMGDYDQQARPLGAAPDVGADEFDAASGRRPAAPAGLTLQ